MSSHKHNKKHHPFIARKEGESTMELVKRMEKVKINNRLDMNNTERFRNICIGFSIQCGRIMNFINQDNNHQFDLVNKGLAILKQIQANLLKLQKYEKKYNKHLNNNAYCVIAMKPYIRALEQVIADVDALVKGCCDE